MPFINKTRSITAITITMMLLFSSIYADSYLSDDEIKTLLSNKTVTFNAANGDQFRAYFAADGSLNMDDSYTKEKWYVENGQHCMTGAYVKCGNLAKNSDGTYSRIDSGSVVANLSKFEDGKKF